jgi:hypothetical protein
MVALFRAVGLESYQHYVAIQGRVLEGIFPASRRWLVPSELSHAYVEVKVDGVWCAIDSHVVDTPLLQAAQARLVQEGRPVGYGTRVDATNVWDGRSDAFSQFDRGLMVEDHGRLEDGEAYFREKRYRHQVLGLRFNALFKLMGDVSMAPVNAQIERIRTYTEAPIPLVSLHS